MQTQDVVFITGGGSGLGRILVQEFHKLGCRVFFTYRTKRDSIDPIISASAGTIEAFQADASDPSQAEASIRRCIDTFGRVSVLVNNAASARDGTLEKIDGQDFDYTIKNVLYPVFYYSKAVVPHMIAAGGGKIISISSVNGIHGREGSLAYSAAKAGIIGMTKTMAKELGKYPVNCNVVAPGYIATDGQEHTSELIKKLVLSECYIKKLSDPIAVCNVITFLASHKADNITGQVFQVDCGQYI